MTRLLLLAAALAFSGPALGAEPATPDAIRAHFSSPQYLDPPPSDERFLRELYRVVLGRKPDRKGFNDWLAALSKLSRAQVVEGFLSSREYRDRLSRRVLSASPKGPKALRAFFESEAYRSLGRTDEEFLRDVYAKVLGRAPDEVGFNHWLAALKAKGRGLSRREAVERFLKSAEFRGQAKGVPPGPGGKPKDETGPPKGEDATRNPGNSVFDGIGLFVEDGARCTPAGCGAADAAKFRAAGVAWIALQIHNNEEVEKNTRLMPGWVDQWRAAGFKVGFWGVSYGSGKANGDGRIAARLTAKHGAQFYIANCEGAFQDKQGDVAENRAFVEGFQAQASADGIGAVPRALSSMGRVALDMRPWIDNGWDALPQAYWNDFLVYQPSLCAQFYRGWGWPAGRIHPTIATYPPTGDQSRQLSLRDYSSDLKAAKTKGFSFYLPENYLDAAQYQQLVELASQGL